MAIGDGGRRRGRLRALRVGVQGGRYRPEKGESRAGGTGRYKGEKVKVQFGSSCTKTTGG